MTRPLRMILVVIIIVLLLLLPQTFLYPKFFAISSSASSISSVSNQYQDRAISLDSSQGRITLGLLNYFTGGQQSVAAYERAINNYFLPLNIRQVLLDIGWENYQVGSIPNETWVSNWLSACDALGIRNLIYMGQFTNSGVGSPWVMSLIHSEPSTQTYSSNGQPANYISFDNPYVTKAVETDLSKLYSYYGNHTSWVGLGTGSIEDNPYYAGGGSLPSLGYSNSSIQQFVNSVYFGRDQNQSGYLPSGSLDALWSSFKNIGNSISLSSGNYVNPSNYHVYGNQTFAQMLAMRFYIPKSEQSIQIQWYGNIVGNPSDLKSLIFPDQGGTFNSAQQPIATQNESASSVSQVTGWTAPVVYNGTFSPGYYWIIFEANSANEQNYYNIFTENQVVANSTAFLTYSFSDFSLGGPQSPAGSSVLWVKNTSGSTLTIYPLLSTASSTSFSQSFVATKSFSFNTVFIYIGPRYSSAASATLSVIDESTGGQVLAQGILNQNSIHGLEGWVPVSLGNTIAVSAGNHYQIAVSPPPSDSSWYRVMQSVISNPSNTGFQNQSQYWLFELGMLDFSQSHFDYSSIYAGPNIIRLNQSLAFRFTPSTSESLQSVQLLMKSRTATGGHYSSGSFTVSLWTNSRTGTSPGTQVLQSVTVPGSFVPLNGLLTVPGFSFQVNGGQAYWIVLSSSDPVGYSLAQFANPYFSTVKLSLDDGKTWTNPNLGASDLSYSIVLSGETIGNNVTDISTLSLSSPSTIYAQPLNVSSATDLSGLFLGPISSVRPESPSDQLSVSIQTDNGFGEPSGVLLASGNLGVENITTPSLNYFGFASIVKLVPGEKYWIVIQPQGGSYNLEPDIYSSSQNGMAQGGNALISTNAGNNWAFASGSSSEVAVLSYSLVIPHGSHASYSTQGMYSLMLSSHSSSAGDGLLHGWNAYLQVSEANTFEAILTTFHSAFGKSLVFSAGIDPNVATQLGYGNIIGVSSSAGNCSSLDQLFLKEMPLDNLQYAGIANSTLLQSCDNPRVDSLAQALNFIPYSSYYKGPASNSKILVVGDNGTGGNLVSYLSNAFTLTYVTLGSDPTLTHPNRLASYSAVVWLSSSNSDSSTYSGALQSYVNDGGQLIVVGASSINSSVVPSWLDSLIGFDPSNVPNSNLNGQPAAQSVLNSLTVNTPYNQSLVIRSPSAPIWIATGGGLTLSENIPNSTSGGKVTFMQIKGENVTSSPQLSNEVVLLSNIIASNLKHVGESPFFYGTNTVSVNNSGVVYGITGGGSDMPILVWLSNPSAASAKVELELNASYYGLTSNWTWIDATNASVLSGTGPIVSINTTIPGQSWTVVYAIQNVSKPGVMFSNVLVQRQLSYPNQGLYYLDGVRNQSVLATIKSLNPVENVSLNDISNITRASSGAALMGQPGEGWYYDNNSNTLFVKYLSTGNDTVRVFYSTSQPVVIASGAFLYPSLFEFATLFIVVAGASTSAYVYIQFKKKKDSK